MKGARQMNYKKIMIPLLAMSILYQPAFPVLADSSTMKTIRANSDIETSIAVAKELNSQSNTYVITTTMDYPDALAGTVLASKLNAPILFVSLTDNQKIFDYLSTRNVDKTTQFYILGGSAVVSLDVENYLKSITTKVVRLGGLTRYDTANLINASLNTKVGTPVIIATGRIYPDGLSMGAIGGQLQYPIYLVDGDNISQNMAQQLLKNMPTTVYLAGGTAVVPPVIENHIKALLPSTNIVRLAGHDRYETSAIISDYFRPYLKETIYTTGEDFHSALVAVPLASQHKASITLVDNVTTAYLATMNKQTGYLIGDITVKSPTSLPLKKGPAITTLTDGDIQYLQSYKQYDGGGSYVSFQDMYTEDRASCDALAVGFSATTLSDYAQAKSEWITSPTLVYRSLLSQYCIRGILSLTYYDAGNKFGLTPNVKYQREVEYRLRNSFTSAGSTLKLENTIYLSDFVPVN